MAICSLSPVATATDHDSSKMGDSTREDYNYNFNEGDLGTGLLLHLNHKTDEFLNRNYGYFDN